jgi:hypothetical protein
MAPLILIASAVGGYVGGRVLEAAGKAVYRRATKGSVADTTPGTTTTTITTITTVTTTPVAAAEEIVETEPAAETVAEHLPAEAAVAPQIERAPKGKKVHQPRGTIAEQLKDHPLAQGQTA